MAGSSTIPPPPTVITDGKGNINSQFQRWLQDLVGLNAQTQVSGPGIVARCTLQAGVLTNANNISSVQGLPNGAYRFTIATPPTGGYQVVPSSFYGDNGRLCGSVVLAKDTDTFDIGFLAVSTVSGFIPPAGTIDIIVAGDK